MMYMKTSKPIIGIIGGTGDLGKGLVLRWASAGYKILMGSRSKEKAEQISDNVREIFQSRGSVEPLICGTTNTEAVSKCDIAVLTVPFTHQNDVLLEIKHLLDGKILVNTSVPLTPPSVHHVSVPDEGSAALSCQYILEDKIKIVSAFHNVSAKKLQADEDLDCDVFVTGDDEYAKH